jgi:hypothetical protein
MVPEGVLGNAVGKAAKEELSLVFFGDLTIVLLNMLGMNLFHLGLSLSLAGRGCSLLALLGNRLI